MDRLRSILVNQLMRVGRQSAQPGSTLERVGRAHIPPSERAATAAKPTSARALPLPVACGPARRRHLRRHIRWASVPHPEKKLVNSLRPPLQGCRLLLQQRGGISESACMLVWHLRHIGQGAEALLYTARAREDLTIPIGLFPHVGPAGLRRRATHHQVRGVHGNVARIIGHNVKVGRDCGHLVVVDA